MHQKPILWIAFIGVLTLAVLSISRVEIVSAQQAGEAGIGGADGAGGAGGAGGGGGFAPSSTTGALAAYGEYVYVLQQDRLYKFSAYDLALVKKINLGGVEQTKQRRGRQAMKQNARALNGGGGGRGGDGGEGDGGQGGAGGAGGGAGYSAFDLSRSDAVAAFGEFVFVLQGDKLHKLAANTLKSVKIITIDFSEEAGN